MSEKFGYLKSKITAFLAGLDNYFLWAKFIAIEYHSYDGDINIVHTHKVARACLGF